MKKIIAKVALGAFFLTSTLISTSFAADEENAAGTPATAAETTATTEARNVLLAGTEEQAVLSIVGGVILLGAVAIASETGDVPTAHLNGHGHGH